MNWIGENVCVPEGIVFVKMLATRLHIKEYFNDSKARIWLVLGEVNSRCF